MKKHVLFVDDEACVRDGLRRILRAERNRWDMRFASSADEALELMRTESFDAVVSDVNMPGKSGFDLLAESRSDERTCDVPVIILTGNNDRPLKRQALNLGATDLLNKPVDPEDLIARLHSAIRLKAYQDELKSQNELLERRVAERTSELADSRMDIVWRLGRAAEFRDEDTGNHVVRVGCYSQAIATTLGLERGFIDTLYLASPLHDIGKIGIPDSILLKRGPLTGEEWDVMKQHCRIGAEILRQDLQPLTGLESHQRDDSTERRHCDDNPFLTMAATIALSHHERWNGSGYPNQLSGESIPLESRIVALADAFDALSSERPYKRAFCEAEVLDILCDGIAEHFDPEIHAAFERSLGAFRSIQAEYADNRRSPEVVEQLV